MNEEANLIIETTTKDEDGYPVVTEKRIPIYVVNEKSVNRYEAYTAMNAGIDVKMILEIRPEDWELSEHRDEDGKRCYARKIEYDEGVYTIRRHYRNNRSLVELTLE